MIGPRGPRGLSGVGEGTKGRGERVLIDSANRPNEQLVSQDPFKSDGSQGRTSPEGEP